MMRSPGLRRSAACPVPNAKARDGAIRDRELRVRFRGEDVEKVLHSAALAQRVRRRGDSTGA